MMSQREEVTASHRGPCGSPFGCDRAGAARYRCAILGGMDVLSSPDSGEQDQSGAGTRGLVVVLNRDLFFGVRIANTLRSLGYEVVLLPTTETFAERLRTAEPPPVLAMIDLGAAPDWDVLRPLLAEPGMPTPTLAFGPHKDVEAMRAAKAAGVTRLVSNGELHRDLVGLVERYARRT
jgi:hypothetical protein